MGNHLDLDGQVGSLEPDRPAGPFLDRVSQFPLDLGGGEGEGLVGAKGTDAKGLDLPLGEVLEDGGVDRFDVAGGQVGWGKVGDAKDGGQPFSPGGFVQWFVHMDDNPAPQVLDPLQPQHLYPPGDVAGQGLLEKGPIFAL